MSALKRFFIKLVVRFLVGVAFLAVLLALAGLGALALIEGGVWLVVFIVALLAVAWVLASLIVNFRAHTWWGVRHFRYSAYTNLIMRTHVASRISGVPYQPTEEELEYIDDVREGRA